MLKSLRPNVAFCDALCSSLQWNDETPPRRVTRNKEAIAIQEAWKPSDVVSDPVFFCDTTDYHILPEAERRRSKKGIARMNNGARWRTGVKAVPYYERSWWSLTKDHLAGVKTDPHETFGAMLLKKCSALAAHPKSYKKIRARIESGERLAKIADPRAVQYGELDRLLAFVGDIYADAVTFTGGEQEFDLWLLHKQENFRRGLDDADDFEPHEGAKSFDEPETDDEGGEMESRLEAEYAHADDIVRGHVSDYAERKEHEAIKLRQRADTAHEMGTPDADELEAKATEAEKNVIEMRERGASKAQREAARAIRSTDFLNFEATMEKFANDEEIHGIVCLIFNELESSPVEARFWSREQFTALKDRIVRIDREVSPAKRDAKIAATFRAFYAELLAAIDDSNFEARMEEGFDWWPTFAPAGEIDTWRDERMVEA